MSSSARTKDLVKLLRGYGFINFRRAPGSSHIIANHPQLDRPIQFANSPTSGNYKRELELRARLLLGLSNRGRDAVEGKRKKPKKRQVPQQRYGESEPAQLRTMAEIRAERTYVDINRLMRERP